MKRFLLRSDSGVIGERLAKRYLEKRGHKVLAQNYYFDKGKRSGEIDLVTRFEGSIRFIEVKTRVVASSQEKSRALYFPLALQITPQKVRKCVKTAEHYLRTTRNHNTEHHFDLVTVLYNKQEKKAEIQYLRDIFY